MSFTKRELKGTNALRLAVNWRLFAKDLAFFAAIGAFMAIVNPFNAAQQSSILLRFVYWTGLIAVGGVAGRLGFHLAPHIQNPAHWALGVLCASISSALAVTLVIYTLAVIEYGSEAVPISEIVPIYGFVFVIALAISSVAYLFDQVKDAELAEAVSPDPAKKFLERLPIKYRTAELYAVSSEDHYLRVHTSMGEELILMRLADAMRELENADGLQTHRSWWVAKAAVTDLKKENGKLTLVLQSGAEVPVSRTYTKAVKDAGFGN